MIMTPRTPLTPHPEHLMQTLLFTKQLLSSLIHIEGRVGICVSRHLEYWLKICLIHPLFLFSFTSLKAEAASLPTRSFVAFPKELHHLWFYIPLEYQEHASSAVSLLLQSANTSMFSTLSHWRRYCFAGFHMKIWGIRTTPVD